MTGYVYFIRQKCENGAIKIGHSVFPPDRLVQIQIWSPFELECISSFEAGKDIERKLHSKFDDVHIRGEWFNPSSELVSLAESIRDGHSFYDLVDVGEIDILPPKRNWKRSEQSKQVGSYKNRVRSAVNNSSYRTTPDHICEILRSGGGYQREYRFFTEEEKTILEDFIAECKKPRKRSA